MNFRYPIFLDLTGKKCLITGEGHELAAKLQGLVDASAEVVYVNPRAEAIIESLAAAGLVIWVQRAFQPEDLNGCFLVISDLEDNSQVFRLAEQRNILCNSADDPGCCRFSFGSIHSQGDLTIAISTNGWAPALAVRLKQQLQRDIGPEYEEFLIELKKLRPEAAERIRDFQARRNLWYRIVDSEVLAKLRNGERDEAHSLLRQMLEEAVSSTSHSDTSGGSGGL